jgi:acyl carrier protein phosphodiesterase
MNYLAHLYLSQADDELALGNFIADFVKGNHYRNFSPQVSKGILMLDIAELFLILFLIIFWQKIGQP